MSYGTWDTAKDWESVDINPEPADLDYPAEAFDLLTTVTIDDTPNDIEDPTGEVVVFYVPGEDDREMNPDESLAVGRSHVVDPTRYA